jgi:hypothetical protein
VSALWARGFSFALPRLAKPKSFQGLKPWRAVSHAAYITVLLGGRSIIMTVDTGATSGQVPAAFADALIADGAGTEGEQETFKIADGSSRTSRTIIITNVNIGGHIAMCLIDPEVSRLNQHNITRISFRELRELQRAR